MEFFSYLLVIIADFFKIFKGHDLCVFFAKRLSGSKRYEMMARGHTGSLEVRARGWRVPVIYGVVIGVTAIAILPHLSVVLTSFAQAGTWSGALY